MRKATTVLLLPGGRIPVIMRDLQSLLVRALALGAMTAAFFTGNAAVSAPAGQEQAKSAAAGQQKGGSVQEDEYAAYRAIKQDLPFTKRAAMLLEFLEKYPDSKLLQPIDHQHMKMLNRNEYNAYRAARREPDLDKRAAMLIEFIRTYPDTNLMEKAEHESIKPLEEQYNAYDAARQEPDLKKRASMLIDFRRNYPKSALLQNIDYDYAEILREASQAKKYDLLESLAEDWLKIHPRDKSLYGYIGDAASNLQKYEKCAVTFEEMHRLEPSSALAREIYLCYRKSDNAAKQAEWAEKLSGMTEFKDDYSIYFDLMMKHTKDNNLAKAAEYAELTLKVADLDRAPDEKAKAQLRKVRRACHHVIATSLSAKQNYAGAIAAYKEAIRDEKYGEDYYGIGLCLDNQKEIEEANLYYAMAELLGGDIAPKAKARLETLYRTLHNNTLIGLNKVYQKAKESLEGPVR